MQVAVLCSVMDSKGKSLCIQYIQHISNSFSSRFAGKQSSSGYRGLTVKRQKHQMSLHHRGYLF